MQSIQKTNLIAIKQFGELIRKRRRQMGLTQEQLYNKSGLSLAFVRRCERCEIKHLPPPSRLKKLCNVLKISMMELLISLDYFENIFDKDAYFVDMIYSMFYSSYMCREFLNEKLGGFIFPAPWEIIISEKTALISMMCHELRILTDKVSQQTIVDFDEKGVTKL